MVTGRRRQEWLHTATLISELSAAWGVDIQTRKLIPEDIRPPVAFVPPSQWVKRREQ